MAWSLQEKNAAVKLLQENFLKQFVQPTLKLIGSFEVDAIICLSIGGNGNEEQLVIKVHERMKHNHFDPNENRNNGEPSLLREYLAGSALLPKPKPSQPLVSVSRKRKVWDENENTIYSPGKRIPYSNRVIYPTVKVEPTINDNGGDENPLNLSERNRDPYQSQEDKEFNQEKRETLISRELFKHSFCGLCGLKCNSYTALQDHFVDVHNSNLRFFCSECSMGFSEHESFAKHCVQHSVQNPSATNRRKQTKPRRGIVANDLSDDDIPQNSLSTPKEKFDARLHCGTPGLNSAIEQSEGIVRSLLQKQSLTASGLSERLNATRHSTSHSSPLALVTRDATDGAVTEFRCPHCGIQLDSWNTYSEHCKQLHKRFACNVCLQTFTQRVNRDRHHYNHTGEKPYECDQCGLGFTRRDALKKHQARTNHMTTPARDTPQQAHSSLMNFQADQDLSAEDSTNEDGAADHPMLLEGMENSETSDYLSVYHGTDESHGKLTSGNQSGSKSLGSKVKKQAPGFESVSQAEDGELSDTGTSTHSCHSGDNNNPQTSDAGGIHAVDASSWPVPSESPKDDPSKSFKCDSCQESVIGTAAYQEHCKVRHRRTPCIFCGKTFSQKGNMERHMRQHTGERPFHCQYCSSSYTRKETLKTHINQAHAYQLNQEYDNL